MPRQRQNPGIAAPQYLIVKHSRLGIGIVDEQTRLARLKLSRDRLADCIELNPASVGLQSRAPQSQFFFENRAAILDRQYIFVLFFGIARAPLDFSTPRPKDRQTSFDEISQITLAITIWL